METTSYSEKQTCVVSLSCQYFRLLNTKWNIFPSKMAARSSAEIPNVYASLRHLPHWNAMASSAALLHISLLAKVTLNTGCCVPPYNMLTCIYLSNFVSTNFRLGGGGGGGWGGRRNPWDIYWMLELFNGHNMATKLCILSKPLLLDIFMQKIFF